jgi:hypothetical protein
MNLAPIQSDVDQDKKLRRMCESCNKQFSKYLYILKSVLYGIFHICEDCKEDLNQDDVEGIQTTFVEKEAHAWAILEEPLR